MVKHKLYDVDLERKIAFCTACGLTEIFVPGTRKRTSPKPICIARARELSVYRQERQDDIREERQSQPGWQPHHILSNINPKTQRAICAVCGPTDIWVNNWNDQTRYYCGTKSREYMRKYRRSHYVARPTNLHALSEIDEERGTAVCASCGPVKIEVRFGVKKITRGCVNVRKEKEKLGRL
jgi:hypothetical protein